LEGKQEKRKKTEREKKANTVIVSSLAKEVGDTLTAGSNRTCSDGRSGENKCGDGEPSTEGRVSSKEPICHGYKQEDEQELLCMWRLWLYGKEL